MAATVEERTAGRRRSRRRFLLRTIGVVGLSLFPLRPVTMTAPLGGKRLELLKRIVPGLARVAVFRNPPNPAYGPILKELEAAAQTLRLTLQRVEVRAPEGFEGAFAAAVRERAGALILPGDPLVSNRPRMVADLALKHRMPTMMDIKEFPEAGGLLSLGLDLVDSYRRAANHVDKILKGASPAVLPMEPPTKFDWWSI
ncbi:MAG: hypothetical protein DMD81_04370 [Candidatus Rokuibacteriota bacterium]|nr:MAG: hypothetical protein DMD81_04370 [Candidatus Rokubacteria bacterium]